MIPPPHPSSIGGEIIDDDAYARYLRVSNWDPNIAAPKLECTLRWMGKVRPGTIRPRHCPYCAVRGRGSRSRRRTTTGDGAGASSSALASIGGKGGRATGGTMSSARRPPPTTTMAVTSTSAGYAPSGDISARRRTNAGGGHGVPAAVERPEGTMTTATKMTTDTTSRTIVRGRTGGEPRRTASP
jgi:hypothetical protein